MSPPIWAGAQLMHSSVDQQPTATMTTTTSTTTTTTTTIQLPFLDGLDETPPHAAEDIALLRQWVSCQPHLPALTDNHLHLFFHSNYCKLEKTKQTIDSYYTIRTQATDLFTKWDIKSPAVQGMLNISTMIRSSKRTPEGYSILMYRLVEFEANKFDFNNGMKLFFMFNDMILSEDGLAPGYIVVLDMKGVTLGHLSTVSISSVRVFMSYIQDAHPARLKGVHVINSVSFIDKVLMIVKPFIKGELMSMLHFHGPVESLTKYVPLESLPSDYGGKGEDTDVLREKYRKMLETKYVPFFKAENQLRVDETKRSGKSGVKMFGTAGSFRSLSID